MRHKFNSKLCIVTRTYVGFVESKTVQYDELGLLATETTTKNAKGGKGKKTNKKNPVKPQPVLVKTAAAVKGLERYFEPRGSIEQELLTKFRVSSCIRADWSRD